jgi:hypothetical protein
MVEGDELRCVPQLYRGRGPSGSPSDGAQLRTPAPRFGGNEGVLGQRVTLDQEDSAGLALSAVGFRGAASIERREQDSCRPLHNPLGNLSAI